MLHIRNCFLFVCLLLFSFRSTGQQPVQVTPQLLPPYSLQVSDYYGGVQPKMQVMLMNRDINLPTITVRLRMTVQSQNCNMQTKPTAITQQFVLPSGVPYFLQPHELQTYFDPNNLDFGGGFSQQEYINSGKFPEGLYTFTLEAYEVVSGNTVSNKGFAMAWLTLADPPLLNTPSKAENVKPSNPQNIIFNWTPRHNTSPTAAYYTDYIFTLVEYNDIYIGPDASFNSSPPVFIDSVTTTTYLYGPDKPQLNPGQRYAWRVQAKAKTGSSQLAMFRNNGFSEVYWFTYEDNCPVPSGISATPVGQRATIEWQADPNHIDYRVEYREKNNPDAEWFNIVNVIPRVVITDLKPGTQYEYRVGASCMEAVYTFSSLLGFTTNGAAVNALPSCGDSSLPLPGGGQTLVELNANDVIHAGSFDVHVGYTSGTSSFTGMGYVIVPWLMNAKVEVRFTNITLSQDYKLLTGIIETTYDPNESGIDDLDEYIDVFTGGTGVGTVVNGGDTTIYTVSFTIPDPCSSCSFTPNGNGNGGGSINFGDGNTLEVDQLPTTIKDGNGNIYQVNSNGDVTPLGNSGGQAMISNASKKTIDTDKGKVVFSAHPDQKYAFDEYRNEYSLSSQWDKKYESLANGNYRVNAKAIAEGAPDIVRATLEPASGIQLIADSVKFVNGKGTIFNKTPVPGQPNTFDVSVVGGPSNDAQELFALYPQSNGKPLNLGKLLIASYPETHISLKIVPVNSTSVDMGTIEASLKAIYEPINVKLTITLEQSFDYSEWDTDRDGLLKYSDDGGLFTKYSQEMRNLQSEYKSVNGVDDSSKYLFVLPSSDNPNVQGAWPRTNKYGYVFTNGNKEVGRTIAHELGHGAFLLKHSFDGYGFSESELTDNLMNYGNGTALTKAQWDLLYDPPIVVDFLDTDDDILSVNPAKVAVSDLACQNFVAPNGKVFSLPNDAFILSVVAGYGSIPNGAVYAFELADGTRYCALMDYWGLTWKVGEINFYGYKKVEPKGQDFIYKNQTYNPTFPSFNGSICVVVNKYGNNCQREMILATYLKEWEPASFNNPVVDYDIETAQPQANNTPLSYPVCNVNKSKEVSGLNELDKYFKKNNNIKLLQGTVKRLPSKMKYYFTDCATGNVKYTMNETGVLVKAEGAKETSEKNVFNNGSFAEDFAVRACIGNDGKWNVKVKFGEAFKQRKHSKISAQDLQAIEEELNNAVKDELTQRGGKDDVKPEEQASDPLEPQEGEFRKSRMSLFEAISAIYDFGENIVSEAKIPEHTWDAGDRSAGLEEEIKKAYDASYFHMPAVVGGGIDQVVEDATSVVQLAKFGLECVRKPKETFGAIWTQIKSFRPDHMKKMLESVAGIQEYRDGGDRARHQSGKHGVQMVTILFTGFTKVAGKGAKEILNEGGEDIGNIKTNFSDLPNGGSQVDDVIDNAVQNNGKVKNLDDQRLIAENYDAGESQIKVVQKNGAGVEVYEGKALHKLDEFDDDLLKKADPDDLVDIASDAEVNNYVRNNKQGFKDGKDLERNVRLDPQHKTKVEAKLGINLNGYAQVDQAQIKLPDGTYMVGDDVWYKQVAPNRFEIIINETKLSNAAPFTRNQKTMMQQLASNPPNVNFELRSKKFGTAFPQGAQLEVKAFVKSVGNGTSNATNITVERIF